MGTIIEYVETNMETFERKPFNAVDSLVLSQFCGVRLEVAGKDERPYSRTGRVRQMLLDKLDRGRQKRPQGTMFGELLRAERFPEMFEGFVTARPEEMKRLMCALAASPRFRDMRIVRYETVLNEEDPTQFAALSFVYGEKFAYIGFRGTDNSIIGWREDFDMGWRYPVPSQMLALDYIRSASAQLPEKLIIGGHSKGGNLAVFAAMRCDASIRNRIEKVYNHDGPGFKQGALSAYDVEKVNILVDKTIPQESIVGMLLEDPSRTRIIRSIAKGIGQHSAFTWEVNSVGTDFVLEQELAPSSVIFRDALSEWVSNYDDEELLVFEDALFEAFEAGGIRNARELLSEDAIPVARAMKIALSCPDVSKSVLRDAASRYIKAITKRLMDVKEMGRSQNGQGD